MFRCKHTLQCDRRRRTQGRLLTVWENHIRQTTYVSSKKMSMFCDIDHMWLVTTDAGLPRGLGHVHFETVADTVNFVDSHLADPILLLDK